MKKTIQQMHQEIFYPTVRVRANRAGGSGTVVYSKKYKGEAHTYIITNHHVIQSCIKIEKKWDPILKKKIDKEILDTVQIEYFKYNNYSRCIGSYAVEADIVGYSEINGGEDWALLRTRDLENLAKSVAHIYPLDKIDDIHIFDKVYACGASLGHPPIATEGHVSYLDDEIDHHKYWMSTAQTIFGNSGGAIYRWSGKRKKYEYIGMPSRISVRLSGFSEDAITHMGYFIPLNRIYGLLEQNNYSFIYDSNTTIEKCIQAQKAVLDNPFSIEDDEDES